MLTAVSLAVPGTSWVCDPSVERARLEGMVTILEDQTAPSPRPDAGIHRWRKHGSHPQTSHLQQGVKRTVAYENKLKYSTVLEAK